MVDRIMRHWSVTRMANVCIGGRYSSNATSRPPIRYSFDRAVVRLNPAYGSVAARQIVSRFRVQKHDTYRAPLFHNDNSTPAHKVTIHKHYLHKHTLITYSSFTFIHYHAEYNLHRNISRTYYFVYIRYKY